MPDLSHLWQRFVLASALVFGLLVGVAATIFGYSNTSTVTVGFAVFKLVGVPLWSVAIVPLVLVLAAGTLYHWWNNLHHFTEHMRHRHRVHELEAEVSTLKTHLDQLLEMPDGTQTKPAVVETVPVETKAETPSVATEPIPVNGEEPSTQKAS
ncbi:MAG TPA: hypothetical protein VFL27_11975 [Candidatus Dormibacteraeota bacterium]|nr:hypothetical protein [Candidatus Dormibacteraeota bacterium]